METAVAEIGVQRYEAYKPIEEAWIGEIPAHWETKKLKHLFLEKKHKSNPQLSCGSISYGKVVFKDDEKIPLSTKASYQEVLAGEFLINPLNLNYDLVSLRIGLSYIDVVVSPGYIVLKAAAELNKEYYKYLLHRYDVSYMKLLGSGVRQTISFTHVANSLLPYPPLEEQTTIANFLDRKTAQIDQAIAQKERLIELLQERRQILIQRAVTRGLNPDAQMKDSGVEWIGEIPAHWEVVRSKTLFTQRKERARDNDIQLSATQAYGVIPQEEYESMIGRRVVKIQFHLEKRKHVELDDFVISMRSFEGGLERAWSSGCIRSSYVVLQPLKQICADFFGYFFKSYRYIKALQSTSDFIRDGQDLNFDNFSDVDLIEVPMNEQIAIADFINSQSTKIRKAIEAEVVKIDKLREYKSTLTNAAVTGKIKVC